MAEKLQSDWAATIVAAELLPEVGPRPTSGYQQLKDSSLLPDSALALTFGELVRGPAAME